MLDYSPAYRVDHVESKPAYNLPLPSGSETTTGATPAGLAWVAFDTYSRSLIDDARALSSIDAIRSLPAYVLLASFGSRMAPLYLRQLERGDDRQIWLTLLLDVAGVDPVPDDSAGVVDEEATAWLDWGRVHGLI
jgi:hypothetical protein